MMKKLLILMLVLGMASVSYGTLTSAWYEADGSTGTIDVLRGQNVTITLNADDQVYSIAIQVVNDNGRNGNALGTVTTPYAVHTNFDNSVVAGAGANSNNKLFMAHATNPVSTFQGIDTDTLVPANADLLSFVYIVPQLPDSTTITINSYNVNDAFPATLKQWVKGSGGSPSITSFGAVNLHIVPEPATIALLGLGGLFLLRRRK